MRSIPFFLSLTLFKQVYVISFYKIMTDIHLHWLLLRHNGNWKGKDDGRAYHFLLSHSSHCQFSKIWFFNLQHSRIPLQLKYYVPNFNIRSKFTKTLQKIILPSDDSAWVKCVPELPRAADINSAGHMRPMGRKLLISALNGGGMKWKTSSVRMAGLRAHGLTRWRVFVQCFIIR